MVSIVNRLVQADSTPRSALHVRAADAVFVDFTIMNEWKDTATPVRCTLFTVVISWLNNR
jgi:hypothetical protein